MRWASLRRYRSQIEEVSRARLREARLAEAAADTERRGCEAALEQALAHFLERSRKGMTGDEWRDHQSQMEALAQRVECAGRRAEERNRSCADALATALRAAQERQRMDILCERERAERGVRDMRQEQRLMDEHAAHRFLTQNLNEGAARRGEEGTRQSHVFR